MLIWFGRGWTSELLTHFRDKKNTHFFKVFGICYTNPKNMAEDRQIDPCLGILSENRKHF